EIAAGSANADIIQYNNGRFIVERRIMYVKNWNLIAGPVWSETATDISIKNTWQGDATTPPKFGTLATGPMHPANGLDKFSTGYSVKWWAPATLATPNWNMVGLNNTGLATDQVAVNNPYGFFVYARGDRDDNTMPPQLLGDSTTLTARGKLFIGINDVIAASRPASVTATSTATSGFFMSVANPFASPISFSKVRLNAGTLNYKNGYSVWDPTETGNYGVGQYQYILGSGLATPGVGLYLPRPMGYNAIQSGQAFMVEANGTGSMAVNFDEEDKIVDGTTPSLNRNPADLVLMSTMLHNAANNKVADGNRVLYDAESSNGLDENDATKILNGGENFGIRSNGINMIVEGRKPIVETDTIFYQMSNLRTQAYKLSFEPRNLNTNGLIAELIDGYLHSRTPVSLTDSTWYTFSTNADAASKAANRFMLVFRSPGGPVPVTFVSIAAQRQPDRSIKINWEVANEINIEKYEVQRSADGQNFTGILQSDATNSRQYTKNDLSPLAADNFYRIKAIGLAGDITYSPIAKVAPEKIASLITVQPNPVKD
ncbi:MAG TPA: hypothetical protein PKU77_15835, partial [Ferruginibacter sp.]|nr:hypothetical protein [Ferruginibacter sp.]